MGILARLLNAASLGLVDGNNLEYQARDGMGLVSEQEKTQRQLQESAQQTQLRQMADENRNAQSIQNATTYSPLFEALNSPDKITSDQAYRQYSQIGAQDPGIRDAYMTWRDRDTSSSIKDAELYGKRVSGEKDRSKMEDAARKQQEARRQQGILMIRRSGGTRGLEQAGLSPDLSPEEALSFANSEAALSPIDMTPGVKEDLLAIGVDPNLATLEDTQRAKRAAQERNLAARKAGAPKLSVSTGQTPAGGLEGSTRGKMELESIESDTLLRSIDDQMENFDRSFLETGTQVQGALANVADKLGFESAADEIMSPEKRESYNTFAASVSKNLSEQINRLSGAAVSAQELNRLKDSLPNSDMSPGKFKSAVRSTQRQLMRIRRRNALIRQSNPELDAMDPDSPEYKKAIRREIERGTSSAPPLNMNTLGGEIKRMIDLGVPYDQRNQKLLSDGWLTREQLRMLDAGDKRGLAESLKGYE